MNKSVLELNSSIRIFLLGDKMRGIYDEIREYRAGGKEKKKKEKDTNPEKFIHTNVIFGRIFREIYLYGWIGGKVKEGI